MLAAGLAVAAAVVALAGAGVAGWICIQAACAAALWILEPAARPWRRRRRRRRRWSPLYT